MERKEVLSKTEYAALKGAMVEGKSAYHVDHWCADLDEHIAQVRHEFAGKPELCALHAALIIRIRRRVALEDTLPRFFDMWKQEGDFLIAQLDSRWLVSAVDTFADHGAPQERSCAIAINAMMNMAMLANTEHMLCGSPPILPEKLRENIEAYPHMWDGRRVFHINGDDTFANTVRRMRSIFAEQVVLMPIFERLLDAMFKGDTTLSRLAPHHPRGMW